MCLGQDREPYVSYADLGLTAKLPMEGVEKYIKVDDDKAAAQGMPKGFPQRYGS